MAIISKMGLQMEILDSRRGFHSVRCFGPSVNTSQIAIVVAPGGPFLKIPNRRMLYSVSHWPVNGEDLHGEDKDIAPFDVGTGT